MVKQEGEGAHFSGVHFRKWKARGDTWPGPDERGSGLDGALIAGVWVPVGPENRERTRLGPMFKCVDTPVTASPAWGLLEDTRHLPTRDPCHPQPLSCRGDLKKEWV